MATEALTGGCQCGAVRYRLASAPISASMCHCRMCQKATGGPFLASATVALADVAWTRGSPAIFRSSSLAERGFCAACGTPLSFGTIGEDRISIALGSLDHPGTVAPGKQIGIEGRVAWWGTIAGLPEMTTEQDAPGFEARARNFQHPDHDTGPDWRPPS